MEKITKILIIKPSSLGDIVQSAPVVSDLYKINPQIEISWLVNKEYVSLVKMINHVNVIYEFDRRGFKSIKTFFQSTLYLIKMLLKIRQAQFDCVIDLQCLLRSAFFSWASGSKKRIGLSHAREGSRFFYTDFIKTNLKSSHSVDLYRESVRYLYPKTDIGETIFDFVVSKESHNNIQHLMDRNQIKNDYCILCPEARWISKQWGDAHYLELAKKIQKTLSMDVLLIGVSKNHSFLNENEELKKQRIFCLFNETTLEELACLIQTAKFMVVNDSGPMHLGYALGSFVYTLVGPTNPKKTGPYRNYEIISSNTECSPCLKRVCQKTDGEGLCLKKLDPEVVMERINESN